MQKRREFKKAAVILMAALGLVAATAAAESLQDVIKRRGLKQQDLLAAAKTYVPSGQRDEFIAFSSTGGWGGVAVYGIPSMRLLKYISVFQPEAWQGYGFDDESKQILYGEGQRDQGPTITSGDTQHPAISETDGDYDGRWLFVNDKTNPRVAVIDLANFETKQIVVNPHFKSEQGGAFVSPDTDYIMETAQYPAPYKSGFAPLSSFADQYRGGVTYWSFDKKTGKIDPKNSFTVELPPYTQDLSDFGKGDSDGWSFTGSFCSELYVGGLKKDSPPFEAGCSANDNDTLHIINWKKAEKLFREKKGTTVNGMTVLDMKTMVDNAAMFLVPAPRSPHGVDVTPDGKHIIVASKMDTNVSVYSFAKIKKAIDEKSFSGKDPYGIPVIDLKTALYGQLAIGLGPLHTQLGAEDGIAYTSLYVESKVAKWNYKSLKVLEKIPVNYNIGHLTTMHGDTVKPRGRYLVAINRLAIDRFNPVGPLHPQNHQLIDIAGETMSVIYDMPMPLGKARMAADIEADLLKLLIRYNPGTNSRTARRSPFRTHPGQEKITRRCNAKGKCKVDVHATMVRSHINPEIIEAEVGDIVSIHLTNLEQAQDETHGFTVDLMNVHASVEPGKTASITFSADREGVFPFYCTELCSLLHLEMQGYLLVRAKDSEKPVDDAAPISPEEQEKYKSSYEAKLTTIDATNTIINSVVMSITDMGYTKDPRTVAMMDDAVEQMHKISEVEKTMQDAAVAGNWKSAADWAEMLWQYQIKATEIGLRIKLILEEKQHRAASEQAQPIELAPTPTPTKEAAPQNARPESPAKMPAAGKAEPDVNKPAAIKPPTTAPAKPARPTPPPQKKNENLKPAEQKKTEMPAKQPVKQHIAKPEPVEEKAAKKVEKQGFNTNTATKQASNQQAQAKNGE